MARRARKTPRQRNAELKKKARSMYHSKKKK